MSYYKYVERTGSLLLYRAEGDEKYTASCQVVLLGDGRAQIHTLNGDNFYKIIADLRMRPFRENNLRVIEAMVSVRHFRLLRIALRGTASLHDLGGVVFAGKDLRRIEIRDLHPMETEMTHDRRSTDAEDSQWRGLVDIKFEEGHVRMTRIEKALAENTATTSANLEATAKLAANTSEIVDFFNSMKGFAKGIDLLGRAARPLSYIAAFIAAAIGVWVAVKGVIRL